MKNIWVFFLLIFILAISLFIALTQGIRINSLSLPKVNIEQLYIKLDKKLIVYAKEVNIKAQSKSENSFSQIYTFTDKLDLLYGLFDTISIQYINYENRTIRFLYRDETFYLDSDFLTIDAQIKPWKDNIELVIKQMLLKDYSLRLSGTLYANFYEDIFQLQGVFSTFNINGSINATLQENILEYQLTSKEFDSLEPFMEFLDTKVHMEKLLKEWIYKRITANEYKLKHLSGKLDMQTGNFYPQTMEGIAVAKDVHVEFHQDAPGVDIPELELKLTNNTLYFDTETAIYEDKNINESDIRIYNLMTRGAGIIIDLQTKTLLDSSIQKILKVFGIDVPIIQTGGLVESSVVLDILFEPYGIKSYIGLFDIQDANFELSGLPMYSKSGTLRLDNNNLHFTDVNIQYNDLFNLYTSGIFELKKGSYEASNHIENLNISFDNSKLLNIHNLQTDSVLKLEDNASTISLESLKTKLLFGKNKNQIKINDLEPLYEHSPLMQEFDIQKGSVLVNTKDFASFDIETKLYTKTPFEQNGNQLSNLDLKITTDGKNLKAQTKDKDISFEYKDKTLSLNLKNHNLLFDSSSKQEKLPIKALHVNAKNSALKDTNSSFFLPKTDYTIDIQNNETILQSTQDEQKIYVKNSADTFHINAMDIKNDYINKLAKKDVFDKGIFNFYLEGESIKRAKGLFTIENTVLRQGKFYSNLMAFFNTVPSLLTLKNPGFNERGYGIEKGFVDFNLSENTLVINTISFDGKSTDVAGKGTINLETDEVNLSLKIAVLKSVSTALKNIPLVNHILLGDDGKMYTNVKISGTLDAPIVKSQAISDAAMTPFEMIKRTLEAPFKLFK